MMHDCIFSKYRRTESDAMTKTMLALAAVCLALVTSAAGQQLPCSSVSFDTTFLTTTMTHVREYTLSATGSATDYQCVDDLTGRPVMLWTDKSGEYDGGSPGVDGPFCSANSPFGGCMYAGDATLRLSLAPGTNMLDFQGNVVDITSPGAFTYVRSGINPNNGGCPVSINTGAGTTFSALAGGFKGHVLQPAYAITCCVAPVLAGRFDSAFEPAGWSRVGFPDAAIVTGDGTPVLDCVWYGRYVGALESFDSCPGACSGVFLQSVPVATPSPTQSPTPSPTLSPTPSPTGKGKKKGKGKGNMGDMNKGGKGMAKAKNMGMGKIRRRSTAAAGGGAVGSTSTAVVAALACVVVAVAAVLAVSWRWRRALPARIAAGAGEQQHAI
eukprot:m.128650 g.128650  ORF g.128650 m.128650 type:complete len:383 (+) comp11244_c0_seq1:640-1788(+)